MFTTDIIMSGSIKVQGHKKSKKWNKHELTASIVDALSTKQARSLGFQVIENVSDPNAPARMVVFRVEGMCTGEAAVGTKVGVQDLVTSV